MMKAGYVALLGDPNAGKSTLLNTILGEKLSIVSDKPQSTRKRLVGIYSSEKLQAAIVDSPGFVNNDKGLNKFIREECEDIVQNSDLAVLLLNVDKEDPKIHFETIEKFSKLKSPKVALITKADLFPHRCLILQQALETQGIQSVQVSAIEKPELCRQSFLDLIEPMLPSSPGFLFDKEDLTTSSLKDIAAEKVREACFDFLHQEIPYGLAVQIRRFDESGRVPKIYADIIVEKENHKVMVIGKNGSKIKMIGTQARQAVEEIMETKIYLELHVNVRSKWLTDKKFLEELGYVVRH